MRFGQGAGDAKSGAPAAHQFQIQNLFERGGTAELVSSSQSLQLAVMDLECSVVQDQFRPEMTQVKWSRLVTEFDTNMYPKETATYSTPPDRDSGIETIRSAIGAAWGGIVPRSSSTVIVEPFLT